LIQDRVDGKVALLQRFQQPNGVFPENSVNGTPAPSAIEALNAELRAADESLVGNEDLLRAVLSGCGDCIKILDLDGNLQFMSDGGKRVMEVDDFKAGSDASRVRPIPRKATPDTGTFRYLRSWEPAELSPTCYPFRAT
jgi:hypothetical protein